MFYDSDSDYIPSSFSTEDNNDEIILKSNKRQKRKHNNDVDIEIKEDNIIHCKCITSLIREIENSSNVNILLKNMLDESIKLKSDDAIVNYTNNILIELLTDLKKRKLYVKSKIIKYLETQLKEYNYDNNYDMFINLTTEQIGNVTGEMCNYFNNMKEYEKKKIIYDLENINKLKLDKPLFFKILELDINIKFKERVLDKFKIMENMNRNSDEYYKIYKWITNFIKIPFGRYNELNIENTKVNSFLKQSKKIMNEAIYGHNNAKKRVLEILSKWINNPNSCGNCIGIKGVMGNGKTTLVRKGIAKILKRPFHHISLGGIKDSAVFEGHDYTYVGSKWGKIIDILINSNCMNPVIYFDELDKVSNTDYGREVIDILMHITDLSQNKSFQDKYFSGIDIDLSRILFIFSFNDESKIDTILLDRMEIIDTKNFNITDKIKIANNYLLPSIKEDINVNNVKFSEEAIKYIIEYYTCEGGVRKLKELLTNIIMNINMRVLKNKLKLPILVNLNLLKNDFMKHKIPIEYPKMRDKPLVGYINGLAVYENGVGMVHPVECNYYPSDTILNINATGSQGDITQEANIVAKIVAWNLLSKNKQKKLYNKWESDGYQAINIHSYETACSGDGPSAGVATTVAILSLLLNIPIRHDIAITGEIDQTGDVLTIGGLEGKLIGAKKAGIKHVLVPNNNKADFSKIKVKLIDNDFKVSFISRIEEAVNISLVSTSKCIKKKLN